MQNNRQFNLEAIQGMDIYILDQLIKGRLTKNSAILDAGCGSCRNFIPLYLNGYDIIGFDKDSSMIAELHSSGLDSTKIIDSDISNFSSSIKFDFVICSAVLHFCTSHSEFDSYFKKLWELLSVNGTIFIRMTSDLATKHSYIIDTNGVAQLPDNSTRYLLTRNKLDELENKYSFDYLDPIKTTNVADLRCMTTLVLKKK